MPRRSASDSGSVFEVSLYEGGLAYGIVVEFPLVPFFDLRASDRPSLEDVLSREVLFRIWIMRSALGKSDWPVVGCASVPSHLSAIPTFYHGLPGRPVRLPAGLPLPGSPASAPGWKPGDAGWKPRVFGTDGAALGKAFFKEDPGAFA